MPLGLDTAEILFKAGEFAEITRLADLSNNRKEPLTPHFRVLLAHALAMTGDVAVARQLAEHESVAASKEAVRSRAQVVLGIIDQAAGNVSGALHRFQTAIRLASKASDDEQYAWAQLFLLRHLIDGHPADIVAGAIREARRAVTRAGLIHAAAYLHQCVSVMEGQGGRLGEANRHCDIAESLLSKLPNAWLMSGLLLNRACIATLRCEFVSAAKFLASAGEYISRGGFARSKAAADSNLGHLQLITGKFESALKSFQRVLGSPRTSRYAALSAYDGLARLHLARNELAACDAALASIVEDSRRHAGLESVYHVRWAAITRARLMLRRGRSEDAISELLELEDRFQFAGDVPFSASLQLVLSCALAHTGRLRDAAARLCRADQMDVSTCRELQGQYYYAAALAMRSLKTPLQQHCRNRALRLWEEQGVVATRLEMDDEWRSEEVAPGASPRSSQLTVETSASPDCVVNSLAGLIHVSHSPAVMGSELLAIIDSLKCSPSTKLAEDWSMGKAAQDDYCVLDLGEQRGRRLTLVCRIPDDPAKAVILGDVLRIGRAALQLERYREDERARAALWPADPVEEQTGALFLAEEMQTLLATARRVAATNVPVLITGETGTGKEILARTIHACSSRAGAPFLPFNCASIPREMLASQLFGHRRGAFTGATNHFPGVIRSAAGGTLFLDEIAETGLDVQPKLLRFLESGEIHPIGDARPVSVDVRIMAATNADLGALVAQGLFRDDLFYRLNIVPLHVPPLRERRVEIPALASHYLQKHAREWNKGNLRLAEETVEYLVLYRWPGNVRQLANEMRRLAALAEHDAVLMPEHLSPEIAASRRTIPASERTLDATEIVVRLDQPMAAAVEHLERTMVQNALGLCQGRVEDAARLLGLSRKGLYLKRQRFGLLESR